jgi:hypothetical protein
MFCSSAGSTGCGLCWCVLRGLDRQCQCRAGGTRTARAAEVLSVYFAVVSFKVILHCTRLSSELPQGHQECTMSGCGHSFNP